MRSAEGAEGIVQVQKRTLLTMPILKDWVTPYFVGQGARQIERLADDFYYTARHYKLSGIPLWKAFGAAELAVLDLLGKLEGKPVAALFGEMTQARVPVYASRFEREQPVEESLARLKRDLARYGGGARTVKLKIGGRMGHYADAFPGRTRAYDSAVREMLGDDWTIYVDANGSYGAAKGIEVGRMLQEHRAPRPVGRPTISEVAPFERGGVDRETTKHCLFSRGKLGWAYARRLGASGARECHPEYRPHCPVGYAV